MKNLPHVTFTALVELFYFIFLFRCVLIQLVDGVRKVFRSGRTLPVEWRRQQLNQLVLMLDEKKEEFIEALRKDLNKVRHLCTFFRFV